MKYYIDYTDREGDLCHVWIEANSKEQAIERAEDEYWDIEKIINVRRK